MNEMSNYKKIKLSDGTTKDEHLLVWIRNNGEIPRGKVIHHIDGDKGNNNIDNLALMDRSEHTSMHNTGVSKEYLRREPVCGTASAYRRGCRCLLCREHQRQRVSDYRSRMRTIEALDEQALCARGSKADCQRGNPLS